MKAARLIRIRFVVLLAVVLVLAAGPAAARIGRSRSSPSATTVGFDGTSPLWAPLYSLVVGGGVEYQSDSEQTEYGFPFLIEYH